MGQVSLAERRRICEAIVGAVDWGDGGGWGYCACPGLQFHHNKNGRRDCRVYAEETPGAGRSGGVLPPGVTCLHTSCGSAIEETSRRIRSEIGKAKVAAADPRVRGGQTYRAVENARRAEAGQKRDSVAHTDAARTARTPVFKFSEKGKPFNRTARTDNSRPYTLYAQAHTRTHETARSSGLPSEPSTGVAPKPATASNLPAKPRPADRGDKVFHPTRLVWVTRAEWERELIEKPLIP